MTRIDAPLFPLDRAGGGSLHPFYHNPHYRDVDADDRNMVGFKAEIWRIRR